MDDVMKWQGAHVGDDTERLTMRVTTDEKNRLEELRRRHGLTSKAQVIRAALDLFELAARPGCWLMDGPESLVENKEIVEQLKQRYAPLPEE